LDALRAIVGLVIVAALLAGVYVYQPPPAATTGEAGTTSPGVEAAPADTTASSGEATTNTTTTTTTITETPAANTSETPTTGEEANETGKSLEIPLNITVEVDAGVVYITGLRLEYQGETPMVTVNLQLPNPCYEAKARYEPGEGVIYVSVTSPAENAMCIQMLKIEGLTVQLDPPPSNGVVKLVVIRDGRPVGVYDVNLDLEG